MENFTHSIVYSMQTGEFTIIRSFEIYNIANKLKVYFMNDEILFNKYLIR